MWWNHGTYIGRFRSRVSSCGGDLLSRRFRGTMRGRVLSTARVVRMCSGGAPESRGCRTNARAQPLRYQSTRGRHAGQTRPTTNGNKMHAPICYSYVRLYYSDCSNYHNVHKTLIGFYLVLGRNHLGLTLRCKNW